MVATDVAYAADLVALGGVRGGRARVVGVLLGPAGAVDVAPPEAAIVGGIGVAVVGGTGVFVHTTAAMARGDCVVGVAGSGKARLVALGTDVVVLAGTGRLGGALALSTTVVGVFVIVGTLGVVLVALGVRNAPVGAVDEAVGVVAPRYVVAVAAAGGALAVAVRSLVGMLLGAIAEAVGDTMGMSAAIASR